MNTHDQPRLDVEVDQVTPDRQDAPSGRRIPTRLFRNAAATLALSITLTVAGPTAATPRGDQQPSTTTPRTMDRAQDGFAAALYHQDGYVSGASCWTDTNPNAAFPNRKYCLRTAASLSHIGSSGGEAHAELWVNVTRSYNGVTVDSPYNLEVANFQYLTFPRFGYWTPNQAFTANPIDSSCRGGPRVIPGIDRPITVFGPAVEAFTGLVRARFLVPGGTCASLHLTQKYAVGSKQVDMGRDPHYEGRDPIRTGMYSF